jgi:Family of unknown function (DUF6580)
MLLACVFVMIAIGMRFALAPLAFAPVAASLLFFGARAPRKHAWIPWALLVGSDVVLTTMVYGYPLRADHLVTWSWYAAMLMLGALLRGDSKPVRIAGASLLASLSFFLASNFAVWAAWDMYPHTASGLAMAYVAGLPFFRNQAVADLVFCGAMFGIGALLAAREPKSEDIATV